MRQLEYARVKLLARGRLNGERIPPPAPQVGQHWTGWRTEWPEGFPVTVTRSADAPAEPESAEA